MSNEDNNKISKLSNVDKLNNEKDTIDNIRDVIYSHFDEMDVKLSNIVKDIIIKRSIKRNIIEIKSVLKKEDITINELQDIINNNIEQINKKLLERITNINNRKQFQQQRLTIVNTNKKYIDDRIVDNIIKDKSSTLINKNNKSLLISQVKSIIEEYDLYNILNKTIKGVNYISDLHKQSIKANNDDNYMSDMHKQNINTNNNDNYRQTIYTLSNNNDKCWFMAAWELIRTILAQEYVKYGRNLPKGLKHSNFAEFDNYLCDKNTYKGRKINTDNINLQKSTI